MQSSSKKIIAAIAVAAIISGAAFYAIQSRGGGNSTPLIVYSADSYVQESSYLLNSYHNSTGVNTAPVKGGGSLTDARQIGQGSPSDVFISVSLESFGKQFLQSRYSGWAVAFAADQMVVAYSPATNASSAASHVISQFAGAAKTNSSSEYNSAFENLTSGKVKVGIANPSSDPAGYRGWLVLEMAGKLYHGNSSYYQDRIAKNNGNVSASDAAELVSPLESGQIQFLFIYKSAAVVKGLNYVQLPPSINLGSVNYSSFYSNFSYSLPNGKVAGAPIFLYITALNGSPAAGEAQGFVQFVLNSTSHLERYGLTPLKPELLYNTTSPPSGISSMVKSGKITEAGKI